MKNVCAWFALTVAGLVSMSGQATGTNNGSQSARRYINLSKDLQAPYSDGVLVGNTLYLSDQIGIDPNTGKLPNDVEQEAHTALDRVKSILAEAGMTMDDLVFVQVFCTDMSLYAKFNKVYRVYFAKDYPARTFVASGSGPLGRGAHFEINGIAVKR